MAFQTPQQRKAAFVAKNNPASLKPENKGLLSLNSSTPASNTISAQEQFSKSSSFKKRLPFRKKGLSALSSSDNNAGDQDKFPQPYNGGNNG